MAHPPSSWRWVRSITRAQEAHWAGQLESDGGLNWMIVEKPGRQRLRLEAYFAREKEARIFAQQRGGRVERFTPKPPAPARPIRVDARLEIVHDETVARTAGRLIIPYGMAFGSGEHATTLMLLRALAKTGGLDGISLFDLGTGSGVLALAARALGAKKIAATDFDPAAIRTARRNELLNFSSRRIRWEVADVKKLRARPRYQLILANLFSGILVESAPRLKRALEAGGQLWLSGVLRSQQAEVASACRAAGLRLLATTTRGKWVMQRWAN
jgi:ribosomal protein L11 methyltransferase